LLTLRYTWRDHLSTAFIIVAVALGTLGILVALEPMHKPYQPRSYCYIKQQTDARTFDFCTNVFGERDV